MRARVHAPIFSSLLLCLLAGPVPAAPQWQYPAAPRIVAVGDVHGAYDELVRTLQAAGVLDASLHWSGGNTQLVSLGDLLDRGADSRRVMNLLMRLEGEAAQAGGGVHVVLGNHETMNLAGELDYVSPGEFAAFIEDETAEMREQAFSTYFARGASRFASENEARAEFNKFPSGYFAHRQAFSADGEYGRWLLEQPVVLVIGDTAFAHGGLPGVVAQQGGAAVNAQAQSDLTGYVESSNRLIDAGLLSYDTSYDDRVRKLEQIVDETPVRAAPNADDINRLRAAYNSFVMNVNGPLWYRGQALCLPLSEYDVLNASLDALGAKRVVVGHTTTDDRVVNSRFDGRYIMTDTGMLREHYGGRGAAVIIEGDRVGVVYSDGSRGEPEPMIRKVGNRPGNLSDDDIERMLRAGEIVNIEEIGTGVTRPKRVTLRDGDIEIDAAFTYVETPIRGNTRDRDRLINISDRWQYNVAAYKIDRILGLELVPVTVERTIDGTPGSLSFWVQNAISLRDKNNNNVSASGWCPLDPQHDLMLVFDALIFNADRTQENILYTQDDWMLRLIDHTRAFRTTRGLPKDLKNVELRITPEYAKQLEALNSEDLSAALRTLLDKTQIRAILARRDKLLKDWGTIVVTSN